MTRQEVYDYARDAYGTAPECLWPKYPADAVLRHSGTKKWYAIVMAVEKVKLGLNAPDGEMVDVVNVKCDPEQTGSWRLKPGILPAYHMNKKYWLTLLLDGTVAREDICLLLDNSYDLVSPWRKKPLARKKTEK